MTAVTFTITLEDGFEGDRVVVRIGDDVVIDEPHVRTDQRIGLAYAIDVRRPDGAIAVGVDVPARHLHADHEVAATSTSLGISIVDGKIALRTWTEPHGYA